MFQSQSQRDFFLAFPQNYKTKTYLENSQIEREKNKLLTSRKFASYSSCERDAEGINHTFQQQTRFQLFFCFASHLKKQQQK